MSMRAAEMERCAHGRRRDRRATLAVAVVPVSLAVLVAASIGCSSTGADSVKDYKDSQGRQCHEVRCRQPDEAITAKIDVLFVTDTSGSLDAERNGIADGILEFLAALPRTTDMNVAVLLAHGSTSSRAGQLFQTDAGEPVVLRSKQISESDLRRLLRSKLTGYATDWDLDTDGGEAGLYATQQLLSGGPLSRARSQGLFRDDAALAVIYVADENDICAVYPAEITPVADPEGREAVARVRDCGSVTAAGVLDRLTEVKGKMPLVVAGVIYTDPGRVPSGPENEVGYGYTDIIALGNGTAVDMSHVADIAAGVGRVGASSAQEMLVYHDFRLALAEVAPETIKASVDGGAVAHAYARETHTVHLEQAGGFGSEVVIDYCEVR